MSETVSPSESIRPIHSLIRHIRRSRKERTILITDIAQSTRFWSRYGDIQGRLMVDRHNWLLFPVIHHFHGRIVKTIGDSILASFKDPDQALQAAIACQQILERERAADREFAIHIRIGLHSGATLVEDHDVFGDVVNTASRLENHSRRDEILLSEETRTRLKHADASLEHGGSFVPKGKSESLAIIRCDWRRTPDLLASIRFPTRLPLVPRQRVEIFLYAAAGLACLVILFRMYLRFIWSEQEMLALILLNPGTFWWEYALWAVTGLLLLGGVTFAIFRIKRVPLIVLGTLKGGAFFLAAFLVTRIVLGWIPGAPGDHLQTVRLSSTHLFVKSLQPDNPIYQKPDLHSATLRTCRSGQLLLLADVRRRAGLTWNKVLVGPSRYGWIPRVLPPAIGIPAKRLTWTDRFYFRNLDLYALLAGLLAFAWGYFTFHIRPA